MARVDRLSPGFVRITFCGEDLADFVSLGFDDHVKLVFANAAGAETKRDYTPRSFDADRRELAIEFVVHGHGDASQWALRAQPGDRAVIGGPKSSMVIPANHDWHLVAGDAAALPAIRRRLEELPADAKVKVFVQADVADRLPLQTATQVEVHWLAPSDDLAVALRQFDLPAGEGFVWCAGEAAAMARVRDAMLAEKRLPHQAMRVAAYWKRDQGNFHQTLESGLTDS